MQNINDWKLFVAECEIVPNFKEMTFRQLIDMKFDIYVKHRIDQMIKDDDIDSTDWTELSKYYYVSDKFIDTYAGYLDWKYIGVTSYAEDWSRYDEFNLFMFDNYDFDLVDERRTHLSIEQIHKFKHKINWGVISGYECFDWDMVEQFKDLIDWNILSYNYPVDGDLVKQYPEYIKWSCLALTEAEMEDWEYESEPYERAAVIEEYITMLSPNINNWKNVSLDIQRYYGHYSIEFIHSIGTKLDWEAIITNANYPVYDFEHLHIDISTIRLFYKYFPMQYSDRYQSILSKDIKQRVLHQHPLLNDHLIEEIAKYL